MCLFCKIANHEIPSDVVYEDDRVLGFDDINPVAPAHVLIIPKRHIAGIADLSESDADLIGHIVVTAGKLAEERNLDADGYRVVANQGENAGQSVPHLHFHLLGGRKMSWPPG